METRTVEQVENWSTRPFTDGYAGLRELSNGEFSGAVRAGGAWLFMLNGRIIGVFEGSLDDFEEADGTAYAAPHPSLPLLFSMQEQGGETRAKYYTNDTPLSEVDSTLSSGKFTGFIELSENVLSGDYYVAYYGGRSMSVAFVGASEQVVTGDDAFERAKDEVGIYEVQDVDVEVTDVPEPDGADQSPDAGAGGATDGTGSAGSSGSTDSSRASESASASTGASESTGAGESVDAGEKVDAGESAGANTSGGANKSARPGAGADSSASEDTAAAGSADADAGGSDASSGTTADTSAGTADASGGTEVSTGGDASTGTDPARTRDDTETSDTRTDQRSTSESASTSPTADAEPTSDAGRSTEVKQTTDAARTTDARSGQAVESSASSAASETPSSADAAIEEAEPEAKSDPKAKSEPETTSDSTVSGSATGSDSSDARSEAFDEEAEWRETTTIPSLDPDRSEGPNEDGSESGAGGVAETDRRTKSKSASQSASSGQSRSGQSQPKQSRPDQSRSGQSSKRAESSQSRAQSGGAASSSDSASGGKSGKASGASSATAGGNASENASGNESGTQSESTSGGGSESGPDAEEVRERIQKLKSQLGQRKQQVEQLKERLSTLESERDEFKRERDALTQEVERLEAKLERTESGESGDSTQRLSEAQAFDGTNLFVRYESKGKSTLDEAAEGKVDADDVNANLRLEHHTQFEAENVQVAGESFESFLTDSFEYRFVSWVIEELLYEIRETGHRNGLRDLYGAIPKIDRVDLHGEVSAGGSDEDTRQESFDVIMRDRMGNPLVVADLNGSREPTTGDMMGSLVDAASGVGEAYDELAGAFQVTESFFEPEALETTETATSGGFLSREKRESFVKLSRKRGYHLCLVESRSGGFHLNVPEL